MTKKVKVDTRDYTLVCDEDKVVEFKKGLRDIGVRQIVKDIGELTVLMNRFELLYDIDILELLKKKKVKKDD